MAINKKFLTLPKVAAPDSTSQNVDFFGDGTGRRLYTFNRDNGEEGGNANFNEVNVENGKDGKIGWGMFMDGTNLSGGSGGSYIDTTSDFVPTTGSFTISFWHKPITTFGYLIARGVVSDPLGGMGITSYTDGGTTGYHRYGFYRNVGSNSSSTAFASVDFSDSLSTSDGNTNWYHIVVSYNSSNNTVMFMRNGAVGTTVYKRASDNATGVFSAMTSGTLVFGVYGSYDYPGKQRIGNRSNSNSGSTLSNSPYTGFINQLRVFNKAVTSTEGTLLSNETIGTWTGTTNTHLFSCVANYNLDNSATESMGTTAYDGTETNVTYELGKFGSSASFNGSSSKIEVSNPTIPNGASSVSFWYHPKGSSGTQYILGQGVATASKGITVYYHNLAFGALVAKGTSSLAGSATSSTTHSNLAWHHIVFTWDGTTNSNAFKVYVNGSLEVQGTSDTSSASIGTYTNFAIGGLNGGTFASGKVDQLRIFPSELTASNVTTLYAEKYTYITKNANQPFGDSSCIAYYKFENNSNDQIGSYNATNNNVTYTTNNVPFGTYAGVFNGTNAYYNISTSFRDALDNNFSISFWMKTPSTALSSSTQYTHASGYYYAGSGSSEGWLVYTYNTRLYWYWVSSYGVGNNIASSANLVTELNQWFHVVVTKTSSKAQIFIDGNKNIDTTSVNAYSMYFPNNAGVQIGCYYSSGYAGFSNHTYDQVRFFNRELTGIEVAQLHEELVYG